MMQDQQISTIEYDIAVNRLRALLEILNNTLENPEVSRENLLYLSDIMLETLSTIDAPHTKEQTHAEQRITKTTETPETS